MSDNVATLSPDQQATAAFIDAAHAAVKRLTSREALRLPRGIASNQAVNDARAIVASAESALAAAYAVLRLHGGLE